MDIYAKFVPESQRRAVVKMMDMVAERQLKAVEVNTAAIN
jgi:hypothetical protein